MFLEENMIF